MQFCVVHYTHTEKLSMSRPATRAAFFVREGGRP
nr:MAG TPA: hypothetical protein [Caudoviricetes sp.]DAH98871.1 MAG TPA: hypothetical protein [Caudoviricetes sp.]